MCETCNKEGFGVLDGKILCFDCINIEQFEKPFLDLKYNNNRQRCEACFGGEPGKGEIKFFRFDKTQIKLCLKCIKKLKNELDDLIDIKL